MDNTEDLAQEIATLSAHLDAATHRLLQCIRSFDESGGWHEQGASSCAHWLSWRVGWDPGTARERVRVANPANEARLLDLALLATGAQLERLCRGYRSVIQGEKVPAPEERSVHRRLLPGGMVRLELVLEPDEAELALRAVDRAREVRAEQAEQAARAFPRMGVSI